MTDLHEIAQEVFSGYDRQGIRNYIHPSVKVGMGVKVWHYAVILADVELGIGVSVGSHCEIGRGSFIGGHSRIGRGVFLPPNSIVGEKVFIGPNVTFTDDKMPRVPDGDDPPYNAQPPIIEDNAAIGAGAVILPGVRIGYGALVGAGAVVTKDVPRLTIVLGSPARLKAAPGLVA